MITVILYAAIGCFLGMLLYSAVSIFKVRRQYPDEASALKIVRTYWFREWAAFFLSTVIVLIYLFCLPEFWKHKIRDHDVQTFIRLVSVLLGLTAQWIGIGVFGVTNRLIKNKANEMVAGGGSEL
jgi:hypothetical protein